MSKKPTLVVVGLGIAGAKLAKNAVASGLYNVVSVEPKDFYEVPFAAVRSIVRGNDSAWVDKTLIPYSSIPGGVGKLIKARVTAVKKDAVVLDNGETVKFNYAVISTGSLHSGKGVITPHGASSVAERKAQLKGIADKLASANNIVVAGGGPVGIEVVGEVLDVYAGKSITLIHSGARLLEGQPEKLSKHIIAALNRHKVKLLLNDKVVTVDDAAHTLTTSSGQTLPADVVVWAAGSRPVSDAFGAAGGELGDVLDAKGRVKVDEHLRLVGHPNIFVLGDINDTPQTKLGFLAGLQADLTVKNLAATVAGNTSKLGKWAPPMKKGAMFVTFGSGDGAGHVNGCVCTGWPIKAIKGKDLFVGQTRSDLGIKA